MRKELELYVHVPFCVRKCDYCDFLSGVGSAEDRRAYVDGLIREICLYVEMACRYEVTTVFFGGGTPSVLSVGEMTEVFQALEKVFCFERGTEISIEVNPGTVDRDKLAAYRELGFNRLSIGLQSVNNEELRNLGRIHTYEEFEDTYRMAREVGFANVNVDLISAIPGQSRESWQTTLQTILALEPQPEHISAYSLIVEEGTAFYERYGQGREHETAPRLPDEDEERLIYQETKGCLEAAGYERYEISNYAKKGFECRHNLGYWERREYLGLGLGASSLIGNERFSNTSDMGQYLKDPAAGKERQELSRQEQMEEFMFLGLRKMQGVSKRKFRELFGSEIEVVYGQVLTDLMEKQLLVEADKYIRLTERGIDVSNYVFAEFLRL